MPSARPLGHHVAVEPADQGEYGLFPCSKLYRSGKAKGGRFLRGKVLKVGPLVGPEVRPGYEVFYEAQSAHPGQTSPFDAGLFGGTPGRNAFIIPVYPAALRSVEDIERERIARTRERARLISISKVRLLDALEEATLNHHELRLGILNIHRRRRSRGNNPLPVGDQASGSGVVAVIYQEQSCP